VGSRGPLDVVAHCPGGQHVRATAAVRRERRAVQENEKIPQTLDEIATGADAWKSYGRPSSSCAPPGQKLLHCTPYRDLPMWPPWAERPQSAGLNVELTSPAT